VAVQPHSWVFRADTELTLVPVALQASRLVTGPESVDRFQGQRNPETETMKKNRVSVASSILELS
jgi:hypothetical protein